MAFLVLFGILGDSDTVVPKVPDILQLSSSNLWKLLNIPLVDMFPMHLLAVTLALINHQRSNSQRFPTKFSFLIKSIYHFLTIMPYFYYGYLSFMISINIIAFLAVLETFCNHVINLHCFSIDTICFLWSSMVEVTPSQEYITNTIKVSCSSREVNLFSFTLLALLWGSLSSL